MSDRLILQGAHLYGVRFGSQTRYCLLDIDRGSSYHPESDGFAIGRMLAALEPLGVSAYLACQSSYRGGIHLYLPFQEAQSSWELAACVAALLENAGFKLRPGQLELFPNPKPYSTTKKPTLFNAHRLPMQAGSYLLNPDFQPVWSDRSRFVQQWRSVQSRNAISTETLRQLLQQNRRRHYRISGKADKFLNDLDTEIEQGWTGQGQTNRLLGRIALRTYVFHHVLQGGEPLTGQALVDQIVAVARSLPGYRDWCRHQHEIEHRAEEWARCVENSHYFHYTHHSAAQTTQNARVFDQLPSWNQQQSETAREKIRRAIADLLEQNSLPIKATARFRALLQYGIGGGSLYRHRDLWHPDHFESNFESNFESDFQSGFGFEAKDFEARASVEISQPVENPPHPPTSFSARPLDQAADKSNGLSCTSLFPGNGGNVSSGKASGDRPIDPCPSSHSLEDQHQLRMQQYLNSGDPILMAEAKAWQHSHQNNSDQTAELPIRSPASGKFQRNCLQSSFEAASPLLEAQDRLLDAIAARSPSNPSRSSFQNLLEISSGDSSGDSSGSFWTNLSDLLAAISVEVRRLCWTDRQVRDRLLQRYGKSRRALLTESELADWLTWLEIQQSDRAYP